MMSDLQLSFLDADLQAIDVNAVDDGVVMYGAGLDGAAALTLSQRPVDDWVFGLGFTNWKAVIDHAIRSGHYELYAGDEGFLGLRKSGFKYAPIPKLPAGGATYVQQRLLILATERTEALSRVERMVAVDAEFSHKCVVEDGECNVTIKQSGVVVRASVPVDQLKFSDTSKTDHKPLAVQISHALVLAGSHPGTQLDKGCQSLAGYILRIANGVR